jgi:hypothetical protein
LSAACGTKPVPMRTMVAELERRYRVHSLLAALKAHNLRSLRLLQRLGFEPADPVACHCEAPEADELLLQRSCPLP